MRTVPAASLRRAGRSRLGHRGADGGVTITLSPSQTTSVLREVIARNADTSPLLGALIDIGDAVERAKGASHLDAATRVLQRRLFVLIALPADGSPRDIEEIARRANIERVTTVRRDLKSWVELGLVRQGPSRGVYSRVPLIA